MKRRLGGLDLGQDVDAVAIFLDHPSQTANLALDSGETFEEDCSFDAVYPGLSVMRG